MNSLFFSCVCVFFSSALAIVQGLHKQHPLVGTLTADIFFCTVSLIKSRKWVNDSSPIELLKESFHSFSDMFGARAALLLLPLLGFSQSDPAFVQEIQEALQKPDGSYGILSNVTSLWPDAIYEQLEEADTSLAGVEILKKNYQAKRQEKRQRKKHPTVPVRIETSLSARTDSYDPSGADGDSSSDASFAPMISSESLAASSVTPRSTARTSATSSASAAAAAGVSVDGGIDDDYETTTGGNSRPANDPSGTLDQSSFYWS